MRRGRHARVTEELQVGPFHEANPAEADGDRVDQVADGHERQVIGEPRAVDADAAPGERNGDHLEQLQGQGEPKRQDQASLVVPQPVKGRVDALQNLGARHLGRGSLRSESAFRNDAEK